MFLLKEKQINQNQPYVVPPGAFIYYSKYLKLWFISYNST